MNILFSSVTANKKQSYISDSLLSVLQKMGRGVTCFDIKTQTSEKNISRSFDIIIAYTKLGLQQILPLAQKQHIPIVYAASNGDEVVDIYSHILSVSRIVMLSNIYDVSLGMLRKDLICNIPLLPPLQVLKNENNRNFNDSSEEIKHILVDISCSSLKDTMIYQLIPLCNMLIKMKISILYEDVSIPPILNSHIKLIDKNTILQDEIIDQSDVVIGNGDTILKSIVKGKTCVVVGEQGYGGIITPENLKIYHQNNFQGRVGGYLNEYIPQHILKDDIIKLTTLEEGKQKELIEGNKRELSNLHKKSLELWTAIVSDVIQENEKCKKLIKCKLRLSSDFTLLPFSNDKFVLMYESSRQVHSDFGKEEAAIIMLFEEFTEVKNALKESAYKDEEEMFLEFIQVLVNEKILMPYEK